MRLLVSMIVAMLLVAPDALHAPARAAAPGVDQAAYCFERVLDDGRPRTICIRLQHYTADVCSAIERDAAAAGLPEGFAKVLAQSSAVTAQGALFDDGHQMSKLIGRKTTPLKDTVAAALKG